MESPEITFRQPRVRPEQKKEKKESLTADQRSKGIVHKDLSNGLELFPIRVSNNETAAILPPKFIYILTTETFKNYNRTPVECDCEDGCGQNCICMSYPYDEQFPEIPYDDQGNIKRFPSKWQNTHRVLWECSEKCKCGPECPSRSAQLGLRRQLEVFMTKHKGWGVRALREIPKGAFIAEYAGEFKVAKDDEAWCENDWYSFDIVSEQGATNFFIDATKKGNVARFFNHGCEPNMMAFHVFYDDNNAGMGMHICFYALRNIQEMEELTFDYGPNYWNAKNARGLGCECDFPECPYRIVRKKSKKFKKAKVKEIDTFFDVQGISTL